MNTKKHTLKFSKWQLIHIRRLIRRGLYCAQGECHPKLCSGFYYVETPLKMINKCINKKP